ncbi:hypothetical protein L5876_06890 [Hyphobacterium sp. SN044]|uniref:hypothetical protein n=1 Tax=Hyphobacterium sp. SN044 TaxID=2912575 RepID=UPI001F31EA5B|nr:hypothetical protein [Hyphobacterium sp. SN044]MCF8879533.1 hypothetical protein [Hyphobacterium sp. SN044]
MTLRLTLASLLASAALIAPAAADVSAERNGDTWQVSASGESLSEVLSAIRDEAGFRLVGLDRLEEDPAIDADLEGTLADVISRLLQGYDYAVVYGETPETEGEIQRIVLLSGRAGTAPDDSQRIAPRRLDPETSEEDGERVSAMLARQVQPLVDADNGVETTTVASNTVAASGNGSDAPSGDGGNGDGGDELDPETQAQLAEATRRAQADLEALVNSLRAHEQGND